MSELKSYDLVDIQDYRGEVYLKSEADKVIAGLNDKLQKESALLKETREWLIESQKLHNRCADNAAKVIAELKADYKEACDRLQTANLIKDEQLAATRHSDYKRCLAMVAYFELREDEFGGDFAKRWLKKWLELAEKFKKCKH